LPPFYIFKGSPGAFIEQQLLTDGIIGCCQINGWFDEMVGKKYISDILIPYFLHRRINALCWITLNAIYKPPLLVN
jgi:hypothetical protein